MIVLFFSGVILLIIFIALVLTKCNETQQIKVLKWVGIFILMVFMINSESFRLKQGEQIEELQRQMETLRTQVNQYDKNL
jgi:steroid 5-alpha reductase family enzyme